MNFRVSHLVVDLDIEIDIDLDIDLDIDPRMAFGRISVLPAWSKTLVGIR